MFLPLQLPSVDVAAVTLTSITQFHSIQLQMLQSLLLQPEHTKTTSDTINNSYQATLGTLNQYSKVPAACQEKMEPSGSCWPALHVSIAHALRTETNKRAHQEDAHCFEQFELSEQPAVLAGVFDGHGGPGVSTLVASQIPQLAKLRLQDVYTSIANSQHEDTAQELKKPVADVLEQCFAEVDDALPRDVSTEAGSTAVMVLITMLGIWVANCGDSRAVLARKGRKAVALTDDHKPERKEEADRVKVSGGQIFYNGGLRVMGVLGMTRAFGDHCLRKHGVVATPEITHVMRSDEDDFVILASDGLWNVLSNERAVDLACEGIDRAVKRGASRQKALNVAAHVLTAAAIKNGSSDNITVLIVDLTGASADAEATAAASDAACTAHTAHIIADQDPAASRSATLPVTRTEQVMCKSGLTPSEVTALRPHNPLAISTPTVSSDTTPEQSHATYTMQVDIPSHSNACSPTLSSSQAPPQTLPCASPTRPSPFVVKHGLRLEVSDNSQTTDMQQLETGMNRVHLHQVNLAATSPGSSPSPGPSAATAIPPPVVAPTTSSTVTTGNASCSGSAREQQQHLESVPERDVPEPGLPSPSSFTLVNKQLLHVKHGAVPSYGRSLSTQEGRRSHGNSMAALRSISMSERAGIIHDSTGVTSTMDHQHRHGLGLNAVARKTSSGGHVHSPHAVHALGSPATPSDASPMAALPARLRRGLTVKAPDVYAQSELSPSVKRSSPDTSAYEEGVSGTASPLKRMCVGASS